MKITESEKHAINTNKYSVYAKVEHLGEIVKCRIETVYDDGQCRIEIPTYDGRGRYSGVWCKTVNISDLMEV